MGLALAYLLFIEHTIRQVGCRKGSSMCELGNQRIRDDASALVGESPTGKAHFSYTYTHTSVDINGLDGALQFDLCKPLNFLGTFDIVTNSGTSEHVSDHYMCFWNIHTLTKVGGVMIHLVPYTGNWPKHGLRYYTHRFFKTLAQDMRYALISEDDIAIRGPKSHLVCMGLQKMDVKAFMPRERFEEIEADSVCQS